MKRILFTLFVALLAQSCRNDDNTESVKITGKDITTAEKVSVDRFSSASAHLFVRTASNGLPAANAPINFDQDPFITQGLNPDGTVARYYNFDVQSDTPIPIFVFFKADGSQVSGQNNIIDAIPGDAGYSDFWLVNKVTVPNDYVANSITSRAEILSSKYAVTPTTTIVNCPVVPAGSTAARSNTAGTASKITLGWYKGKQVSYFDFQEAPLTTNASGKVPFAPIRVMFNDNNAGPSSGFKTETGTKQTHNVIALTPSQAGYSPLWDVFVLNNSNFNSVTNWATSSSFPADKAGALVNCPVVK